jgi:hypothetical protein
MERRFLKMLEVETVVNWDVTTIIISFVMNTQKLWIGYGRYKLGWINILAIIQGKKSGVLIQREENMSENLLIFSPIRMERPILSWSVTGILVRCSSALDRKRHCSVRRILLLLITKQYTWACVGRVQAHESPTPRSVHVLLTQNTQWHQDVLGTHAAS